MKITIEMSIDEVKELFGGIETNEEEHTEEKLQDDVSCYARIFDDSCAGWTKDSEYNMMYLKSQQDFANNLLRTKGQLYLNEVYDMLDMPRSKAGQLVGWIYDEENPIGDNFVSFELYNPRNADFINGYKPNAILDFNVDGIIIDKL